MSFLHIIYFFRRIMIKESKFQHSLIQEIKKRFPGAIVLKTDPGYLQGFPDLLILWNKRWAVLEVKREAKAHHQPNQDYYISVCGEMSFASFIFPENRKEVLDAMEQALQS